MNWKQLPRLSHITLEVEGICQPAELPDEPPP